MLIKEWISLNPHMKRTLLISLACLVMVLSKAQPIETTDMTELPALIQLTYDPTHSIARNWNEVLLTAIRRDFARPTVHARNLFHSAILMYDLWSLFKQKGDTYLLSKSLGNSRCEYPGYAGERSDQALSEAISYGMYRLLSHRFSRSEAITQSLSNYFYELGYDSSYTTTELRETQAAALGNYLAQCIISYGLQDGANEDLAYSNIYYFPVNRGLEPNQSGNPYFVFPNRWQPLIFLTGFVDQSGNVFEGDGPVAFLSAEWGAVQSFALPDSALKIFYRQDIPYYVYHDPGPPPQLGASEEDTAAYLWNFAKVAQFSADLDPNTTLIDISPAGMGNIPSSAWPQDQGDYESFFTLEGGMMGPGYTYNPVTGEAYEPHFVPLGDYARVLAEFWADGPDSETPPGHWFTMLNYVSDHPAFERRFAGEGEPLDPLEWDVKAYFVLGGALHDAAVTCWGIKGWYDYPRPISVIRFMASQGQSSDSSLAHYSPYGFPLIDGFSALVTPEDPLAGADAEHVGKVKIRTWRGPQVINDPETDVAGVDWILAENWWPYQRPSFITPPFAGYTSGHSTFSRAAADVLTYLTGSPYFPAGLGKFTAKKNEFLVFEQGPSVDVVLQWASYADASDQTSLSRIWGGIHPPVDDIPGRRIGAVIARDAFDLALEYFAGNK